MHIPLVETETSFPLRVVLCTETETLLIERKENMTKVKVNNNIYYYEVISKSNVHIIGLTVFIPKQHKFGVIFTSDDVLTIQYVIGKVFFRK